MSDIVPDCFFDIGDALWDTGGVVHMRGGVGVRLRTLPSVQKSCLNLSVL